MVRLPHRNSCACNPDVSGIESAVLTRQAHPTRGHPHAYSVAGFSGAGAGAGVAGVGGATVVSVFLQLITPPTNSANINAQITFFMTSPFAITTVVDTRAVRSITRRAEAGPVSTEPNPSHIVFNRLETPVSTLFLPPK